MLHLGVFIFHPLLFKSKYVFVVFPLKLETTSKLWQVYSKCIKFVDVTDLFLQDFRNLRHCDHRVARM